MKTAVSNFTTVRPVGAALMHVDRRTDGRTYVTKLIGAFSLFMRISPKTKMLLQRSGSDITFTLHGHFYVFTVV
jgi:hypothetical protein